MRYQLTCQTCDKKFESRNSDTTWCSKDCRREQLNLNGTIIPPSSSKSTKGKRGDISELEVSAYYLREGWEVFRNVSANGPADIVIWNPDTNEVKFIDVKTCREVAFNEQYRANIERKNSDTGVKVVSYNLDTKQQLRGW